MSEFTNIVNNIPNCSIITNTAENGTNGKQGIIQLQASNGYKFKDDTITLLGGSSTGIDAGIYYYGHRYSYSYIPSELISFNNDFTIVTFDLHDNEFEPSRFTTLITISGNTVESRNIIVTNNINNVSVSYTIENNNIIFSIVGNTISKRFTTVPTITYTDVNDTLQTITTNVNVSSGVSTATATISNANLETNTFTINGVYDTHIDIINNIENATYSVEYMSTDVNITIYAPSLHKFTQTPYLYYYDKNTHEYTKQYFSLNNAQNVGTAAVLYADFLENIELFGSVYLYVNVVNNVPNSNVTYNYENNNLSFLLTPYENYAFKAIPTITFNNVTYNMQLDSNENAIYTVVNANLEYEYILNGFCDKFYNLEITANNCSLQVSNYKVFNDTILNVNAIANQYYKFETQPILRLRTLTTDNQISFIENALEFDFADVDFFDNLTHVIIYANAVVDSEVVNKYGSLNLYVVNEDILNDFAKIRFTTIASQDDIKEIDKGIFINSLKRCFVSNLGILLSNKIALGNYLTNIECLTPLNVDLTLDFGSVLIPYKNNDLSDFNNELSLFLPFYGFVSIDSKFVGKNIKLVYKVNLITCNTYAMLYYNNYLIESYKCNVGNDIIYKTLNNNDSKHISNIETNNINYLGYEPYIILSYKDNILKDKYNNDSIYTQLSELSEYNEVEYIIDFDKTNISNELYETIVNTLKNGVIF